MKSKLLLATAFAAAVTFGAVAHAKPDANQLAAVADKNRPATDTAADADRKPAEMLEFAGVKQGQTVVDLLPGGGYFTRIFSKAVGPKGTVYAVGNNPRPPQDPAKPPPPPAQDAIAADPNYSNVKSIHVALINGPAMPTKADLVWTAQNMGTPQRTIFFRVIIPAAAPQLFSGVRIGLAHAFVVLFAAELIGSKVGLGTIISSGEEWVRFDLMFAGIVCFAVLGFVSDRILLAVRARVLKGQMIGTEEQAVR